VSAAEFLAAAARLDHGELRALIRTLSEEEQAVSTRRLALHRLIDRVRTELIARAHDEVSESPGLPASERELQAWAERAFADGAPDPRLDGFSAADAGRLLRLLRDVEADVSERRRELHAHIDLLHEELLDRLQRRIEQEPYST
jgi:hypothetical protein